MSYRAIWITLLDKQLLVTPSGCAEGGMITA